MEMEKNYVAPMVEIFEIKVEKGFQSSENPGFDVEQP